MFFENDFLNLAKQKMSGDNIYLRMAQKSDYIAWQQVRNANYEFLQPFEPIWAKNALTKPQFYARVRNDKHDASTDAKYAFFIFKKSDDSLIGGINMNNVQRGVFQCCALGYWLSEAENGQGYMSEAVNIILQHSFGKWKFNRVQAATLHDNHASIKVLEKNGFEREGEARRYLKINGKWQDHVLFAKIAP